MRMLNLGLVLLIILQPGPQLTQDQPSQAIERMQVDLWPEYDQRSMLVIYRLELPADTTLPATVRVPIPADAGEPHAVAVSDTQGSLLLAPYTRSVEGNWATITLRADFVAVQVEYYANLVVQGQERSYVFDWPGGVEIASFGYKVQQPAGVDSMQITPTPGEQVVEADGLVYYVGELGELAASSATRIELSYAKSGDELTVDVMQSVPPLSRPEEIAGETPDLMSLLPWIVGGFLLLLIAAGAGIYIATRPSLAKSGGRVRRRRSRKQSEGELATVYCHVCGLHASAGDRFCRSCGARLRQ